MPDNRKYYVICADNCKFESMTKEQILSAIEQAITTGEIKDVDTGFVTKIKEQNTGAALTFWVGTKAEYNALETKARNCFYIITDDTDATAARELLEETKLIVDAHAALIGKMGDYVIEQGVVNGFTYRKWNSGVAECWGIFKRTVAITTSVEDSGGYYRSDVITEKLPENLFKTITDTHINDARSVDDAIYLSRLRTVTKETINYFCLRAGKASPTATFDIHIMIKGTWK